MTIYTFTITNIEDGQLGYISVENFLDKEAAKQKAQNLLDNQCRIWGVAPVKFRDIKNYCKGFTVTHPTKPISVTVMLHKTEIE